MHYNVIIHEGPAIFSILGWGISLGTLCKWSKLATGKPERSTTATSTHVIRFLGAREVLQVYCWLHLVPRNSGENGAVTSHLVPQICVTTLQLWCRISLRRLRWFEALDPEDLAVRAKT